MIKNESFLTKLQAPLAMLSAVGFVLSLLVHLDQRLSMGYGLGILFLPLFFGVFLVWFPTAMYMQRFNRAKGDLFGMRIWKYVVSGAPRPLVWIAGGALVYAMVNFFLAIPQSEATPASSSGPTDPFFVLLGTGHTMAFYALAWVVNHAAVRRREEGTDWVCEQGHSLSPTDKFCTECGQPARKPAHRQSWG